MIKAHSMIKYVYIQNSRKSMKASCALFIAFCLQSDKTQEKRACSGRARFVNNSKCAPYSYNTAPKQ